MRSILLISLVAVSAVPQAGNEIRKRTAIAPDGMTIAYYPVETARTTPLIIIAAGPGSDARYMRVGGALERLARTRTVVFYDQRGTGQSADSKGNETVDIFVEDLEAIRGALNAPQIDLLGHSFGGYLAMAYTAKHGARVRSLTFIDALPPKASDLVQLTKQVYPDRLDQWRRVFAGLGKDARNADTEIFQSMAFVDPEALRRYLPQIAAYRFNAEVGKTIRADIERLDYWPQVRQFRQPTLILHGRFDAIVALSNSWTLHQAIPGSRFYGFETAGHVPHVERPEEFFPVVSGFLGAVDDVSGPPLELRKPRADPPRRRASLSIVP